MPWQRLSQVVEIQTGKKIVSIGWRGVWEAFATRKNNKNVAIKISLAANSDNAGEIKIAEVQLEDTIVRRELNVAEQEF